MSQHLSDRQIENFISRKLPPSDVLLVDDHLAACDICMQKAQANRSNVDLREILSAGDEHLTYEQMTGLVDETLSPAELEIAEAHRQTCDECSLEIASFRKLHDELAASTKTAAPIEHRGWLNRLFAKPYLRIAVPVMGALIVVAIVWALLKNTDQPIAEVTPPPVPTPSTATASPENNGEVNSNGDDSKVVAALIDAGGKIEIDEHGNITGINAGDLEPKLRAALKDQPLELPSDLRQLKSSAGVLMGSSDNGVPFKITGPVGRVVESHRPSFTWQPLKDANSYKVGIYDNAFNEIASSPELHATKWTPAVSLKRGVIYQWQVTAIRNGEEIKSPVRPAPEAKFKIADQSSINEIEKARRSNSHLLLGIAYANAGLIDEAEREFQVLQRNNPNSDIARKLLARVRSGR
jgi:hypothetical protein